MKCSSSSRLWRKPPRERAEYGHTQTALHGPRLARDALSGTAVRNRLPRRDSPRQALTPRALWARMRRRTVGVSGRRPGGGFYLLRGLGAECGTLCVDITSVLVSLCSCGRQGQYSVRQRYSPEEEAGCFAAAEKVGSKASWVDVDTGLFLFYLPESFPRGAAQLLAANSRLSGPYVGNLPSRDWRRRGR
jgi:hypothetical protein